MTADTIYALSSGSPPAAIAVIRISGPQADAALQALGGRLPPPRRASLVELRQPAEGGMLDRALVLRFPGPQSATGEDVVELHLHGGRAMVSAVLAALKGVEGLREAGPGEFTRRAFENGRIDLAEAEGLADLLSAETESQRRAALAMAGGALGRLVSSWQEELIALSARIEATIDFSDEGEVGEDLPDGWTEDVERLASSFAQALSRPAAERLRDGVRVAIAGPPNAGKSSLLNWLVGRQAAITSAIAGTTRDLIEAPTAIAGTPFVLVDTAGLRESTDPIEAAGVGLAQRALESADLVLWLGDPAAAPEPARTLVIASKADLRSEPMPGAQLEVSAETGEGMEALVAALVARARTLLPAEGEAALNARHRRLIAEAHRALAAAASSCDHLIAAESLRNARQALDRITGRGGVDDLLDSLFGRFCIGK